jgi:nucleoid-associated protein YgaU
LRPVIRRITVADPKRRRGKGPLKRNIWIGIVVVAALVLFLGYREQQRQPAEISTTPSDTPTATADGSGTTAGDAAPAASTNAAPESAPAPSTGATTAGSDATPATAPAAAASDGNTAAPATAAPSATETAAVPATGTTDDTTAVPTTTEPAATSTTPAAEPPAADKPAFDVVRVDSQGGMVIAGRATPGSEITVTSDGAVVGTTTADDRGEWVLLPSAPLKSGNHSLDLSAKTPDGKTVAADSQVLMVVPEPAATVAGAAAPKSETLAVLVPQGEGGGSQVLQAPSTSSATTTEAEPGVSLSLDTIDYDDTGRVTVGGRAAAGGTIQAYLDNQLVGAAVADGSNHWLLPLPMTIDTQPHTLRIDQVGTDGKVVARVESPFQRAETVVLAKDQTFIVQPGNSLWRIARRSYGEGLRYTVIYEANKDQIRNPDMIYPGQVFVLPENSVN